MEELVHRPERNKVHKTSSSIRPTKKSPTQPLNNQAAVSGDPGVFSLPEFVRAAWVSRFLPTLYHRFGSCVDPWNTFSKGDDMLKIVQELINTVYPDNVYHARWGDKITYVV